MRRLLVLPVLVAALTACSGSDGGDRPVAAPARTTGSPAQAPTRYDQYVALGDSYTAAPLVPPTDTSTICLRSGVNYPALVAQAMPGTALTDVSCSGASTRNTFSPQVGRTGSVPPQFDALRRTTDLVTIGLGGNDGQLFGGVLGRCMQIARTDPGGDPCTRSFRRDDPDLLHTTLAGIERHIADVVRGVRERSPHARILVVGYPQIIPETGTCDLLPLADGDYPFARSINEGLDRAVRRGAVQGDAEYVDLWHLTAGHDICADDPWINGRVTSAETALAYHPLAVEQEQVAQAILDQLS
ncbi:SGNH/GDSL hydrolase family protein [Nocardioides sp. URHA0032]|uniref:SGNH/GDSL hydrolase family protein n=1 Tax=Nocardioides sp. URHA0032 TaxID=1380388 RepID=UPI00049001A7|nr:SGNH/GDSL hydrolase family protein [Nocardioides sp. URHA0032]